MKERIPETGGHLGAGRAGKRSMLRLGKSAWGKVAVQTIRKEWR